MPAALTYPGVYIEEIASGVRTITGVSTSITLFLGWAPRGPGDRAVRISSFTDYQRQFGGLDQRTVLGHSVKQFFDNGGADAYIVRLVDSGALTSSATIGVLTVKANSPGLWGDRYSIRITPRPAPDDAYFRIEVLDTKNGNAIVELFENLSTDDTQARFAKHVINGRSSFIEVSVSANTHPTTVTTTPLTGGTDGPVYKPTDAAFLAAVLAKFGVGTVTDRIDLYNIVCVPGMFDAATLAILQADCQRRRAFLICDCDPDATVASLGNGAGTALTGSAAPNSAIYFPWVKAPDVLAQGALVDFPPSGFVAGVFARTDSARGVWKSPAGSEASLNGAAGLKITMSDAENGQLNPLAINCLRTMPVFGNIVWGARTLHGQSDRGSEWKYVPVRRMTLFIEESLYRGTQWVVFEPNDEPLWAQIRLNVGAFLQSLFRQGAFQGQSPRDAYFVKCDKETTTQDDINRGIVNIVVGFAPLKPAEFVVIKLQQIAGQIQA